MLACIRGDRTFAFALQLLFRALVGKYNRARAQFCLAHSADTSELLTRKPIGHSHSGKRNRSPRESNKSMAFVQEVVTCEQSEEAAKMDIERKTSTIETIRPGITKKNTQNNCKTNGVTTMGAFPISCLRSIVRKGRPNCQPI